MDLETRLAYVCYVLVSNDTGSLTSDPNSLERIRAAFNDGNTDPSSFFQVSFTENVYWMYRTKAVYILKQIREYEALLMRLYDEDGPAHSILDSKKRTLDLVDAFVWFACVRETNTNSQLEDVLRAAYRDLKRYKEEEEKEDRVHFERIQRAEIEETRRRHEEEERERVRQEQIRREAVDRFRKEQEQDRVRQEERNMHILLRERIEEEEDRVREEEERIQRAEIEETRRRHEEEERERVRHEEEEEQVRQEQIRREAVERVRQEERESVERVRQEEREAEEQEQEQERVRQEERNMHILLRERIASSGWKWKG
jgi:hypothetical protein